jgi:hypothetical protein
VDANGPETLADLLSMDVDKPLDGVRHASGRAMSVVSVGLHTAAENLLVKALRAARSGDLERAEVYVTRAVRLDFDHHEQVHPAPRQAQMLLFTAVTDALEECELGDGRWLDAALTVLPDCDEHARVELLSVLADIDHDWHVEPDESRRIRAAIADLAPTPDADTRSVPEAEQVRTILQVLDVVFLPRRTWGR